MAFDALSSNEQYASLCIIKFKFMDHAILFIEKATFQFRRPLKKIYTRFISTKSMSNMFLNIWWYMWYVFVLVKTDSDS